MPHVVAVGTSIPEFVATNEYVVSLAREASKRSYMGEIDKLESDIKQFLTKAGARERRWRAGFTKPIEHIFDAWQNCFVQFGPNESKDIGTLIYCGIDRGVAEPSHASLLAQKFGLRDVRTLDVSDACMGWFTATQVAKNFASEEKPYCVIVSAEFPLEFPGKLYPQSFTIRDDDDLSWKGAAMTLGEAASVTIIDARITNSAQCNFKSNSKWADICYAPLLRADRFVDSARLVPKLIDDCFVAHMPTMASASYRDAQEVLTKYISENGIPTFVLPHLISQTGPLHASKSLLKEGALRNCFEYFGNLATSSIPVGYEYFACESDKAAHLVGWISAAGMSHSAFRIW
jgi:3-oxoacyl-[acyl-carrier-protein] synthase III